MIQTCESAKETCGTKHDDSRDKLCSRSSTVIKPFSKMLLFFVLAIVCMILPCVVDAAKADDDYEEPSSQPAVPKTLDDKAEAIEPHCERLANIDKGFQQYCETVYVNYKHHLRTTGVVTRMDSMHMATIVAMENARNKGLNLVYLNDDRPEALVDAIKNARKIMPSGSTVRFLFTTTDGGIHHAFAEVKLEKLRTAVVVFDSTMPFKDGMFNTAFKLLRKQLWKVSAVLPQIQKSTQDCLMFSLHFALKSYQTGFGEKINKRAEGELIDAKNKDQIPIDFFMHSQTRDVPEKYKNKPVDKGGRTLENRLQDYKRMSYTGIQPKEVGVSIEGFRMQEIRRVAEAYQRNTPGFDHSLEKLYVSSQPRTYQDQLIPPPSGQSSTTKPPKKNRLKNAVVGLTGLTRKESNRP